MADRTTSKRLIEKWNRTASLGALAGRILGRGDAPMAFPPGHFYSPIPSLTSVFSHGRKIFEAPRSIPGIDLNEIGQVDTIRSIRAYCERQPFAADERGKTRFVIPNDNFSAGDALIYFGLLGFLRPRHVIEIGSGYSTLVLLDALDLFQAKDTGCTCIEPFPDLLHSILWPGDENRIRMLRQELQDVDLSLFDELQPGDILFVDSTHVSKTASDVNAIFFHVLPRLAAGVYIHFHDIYYPFEYPEDWVRQGRAWNEVYVLRAFLQYNTAFEICCFNSFLAQFRREMFEPHMPLFLANSGSGLWLRKR